MDQCPYCKQRPRNGTPKVVCHNCRNYADASEQDRKDHRLRKLFAL